MLEQFVPNGPNHPFAVTMLNHFEKIQTPLKSIGSYPSEESQCKRFSRNGWTSTDFRSLWEIWQDDTCTPTRLRQELDDVELFDEWEEFALFACHYFVLLASNPSNSQSPYFKEREISSKLGQNVTDHNQQNSIGSSSELTEGQ